MPIYEYICKKCNKPFAVLQKVGTEEKDTACSTCGSKNVKKLLSSFSCSSADGNSFSPSVPHRSSGGG